MRGTHYSQTSVSGISTSVSPSDDDEDDDDDADESDGEREVCALLCWEIATGTTAQNGEKRAEEWKKGKKLYCDMMRMMVNKVHKN